MIVDIFLLREESLRLYWLCLVYKYFLLPPYSLLFGGSIHPKVHFIFSTFIVGLRLRTYGAYAAHIWCWCL